MKKYITIVMASLLILTGCSMKSERVKVGATAGAMTGVAYGAVAVAMATSDGYGNSDSYGGILLGTVLMTLFGLGVGATTGYVLVTQSVDDESIEEIKQSIEYTK